nr:hypothetical protein [Tanacetum cinerariifolium]
MLLIQKLRDDQKGMKKVEPSSRSKVIQYIISIGSFVEALILNHYVLVRKIFSNITPIPILDEIIALSGETKIPKASLTRVRTAIREMESKSDKDSWKDAINCFKKTKD